MATRLQNTSILTGVLRSTSGQSSFVCNQCRSRIQSDILPPYAYSPRLIGRRHASTASGNTPFTERLRRKIWGSETPPGQEDPYKSIKDQPEQVDPLPVTAEARITAAQLDYVPATTWEGLDHIGGATGWWEEAWDAEHKFSGFMPSDSILSDEEVKHAVRRATIEVFAMKEAKLPLTTVCQIPVNSDFDISDIKFTRSKGKTSIVFGHGITQQNFIDLINTDETNEITAMPSFTAQEDDVIPIELSDSDVKFEQSTASDELTLSEPSVAQGDVPTVASPPMASEVVPVHDDTWLAVPLGNSAVKFAVLKRAMQLTGKRISDTVIAKINGVAALVDVLTEKPKPKKLAEQLLEKPELANIRNIQIFDRRYTPIDKEQEVGRWKVIERELQKRGLPVTGRA